MKYNMLGATSLRVSQLGFGCGAIGGLLVRGDYPEMRKTVARAIELGVTYFDTAALYGNGQSEVNLGAVLRELGADIVVGTKARPAGAEIGQLGPAIVRSVEASLKRLGRDSVDLIQLHNRVEAQRDPAENAIGPEDIDAVVRTFETLRQQGKIRFWGINGLGSTAALQQALAHGGFHSVQIPYSLLNPSAAAPVPPDFAFQDYKQLIGLAAQQNIGVIAIRILAGGALSGVVQRHANAARSVDPIATEQSYEADVAHAQRYRFLVDEGIAASLVEAAIRFAAFTPGVSTALVGISNLDQLEQAAAAVERGPLPHAALAHVRAVTAGV